MKNISLKEKLKLALKHFNVVDYMLLSGIIISLIVAAFTLSKLLTYISTIPSCG